MDGANDIVVDDSEVIERPSQARALVIALAFGLPVLAAVMADAPTAWIYGTAIAFGGGLFGAMLGLRKSPKTGCRVRVTSEGLDVDGTLVARRADLSAGTLLPSVRTHAILTRTNGHTIDVATLRLEDARAILDALGLGAAKVTADFSTITPALASDTAIAAWMMSFIAVFVAAGIASARFGGLAAIFAFVASLAMLVALAPARVTVGVDALVVRWLGRRTVIPLAGIARVERISHRVRLHYADGRTRDIAVGMPMRYAYTSVQSVAAIAERIETALAARSSETAPEASALARASRSIAEWVADLRRATSTDRGFRGAALIADRLWPIVESGSTDASTRVAAAVALAPTLDDEGRARIRVAASASASPKLRVALEAALTNDDERVVEALDALEMESR